MIITSLLLLATVHTLPIQSITPGEADPRLTSAVLLDPKFRTGPYRPSTSVTNKIKVKTFALYGIAATPANMKAYELDHLISIELGGASTIKNLWPEPWDVNVGGFDLGAHTKDKAENAVRRAFVARKITLAEAQRLISVDWTVAYKKYVAPSLPKFGR